MATLPIAPGTAFLGFDTGSFPGTAAMQDWWDNSEYQFVGYYLNAPCHGAHSFTQWEGNFGNLTQMGWALLVIYVGQQRPPHPGQHGCGQNTLTQAQGQTDAQDAVTRTTNEGFPGGTFIYLDLEGGDGFGADFAAYLSGWVPEILAGGFGVAFYCSYLLANDVQNCATGLGAAQVRVWVAGIPHGAVFNNDTSVPSDSGIAFATVWQSFSHDETYGTTKLNIDSNVSTLADPSGP